MKAKDPRGRVSEQKPSGLVKRNLPGGDTMWTTVGAKKRCSMVKR